MWAADIGRGGGGGSASLLLEEDERGNIQQQNRPLSLCVCGQQQDSFRTGSRTMASGSEWSWGMEVEGWGGTSQNWWGGSRGLGCLVCYQQTPPPPSLYSVTTVILIKLLHWVSIQTRSYFISVDSWDVRWTKWNKQTKIKWSWLTCIRPARCTLHAGGCILVCRWL